MRLRVEATKAVNDLDERCGQFGEAFGSEGYVYVIGPAAGGGPWKIGKSFDVPQRLSEIQRMSPVALKLFAICHGYTDIEALLHADYKEVRAHGEWFDLDEVPKLVCESGRCVFCDDIDLQRVRGDSKASGLLLGEAIDTLDMIDLPRILVVKSEFEGWVSRTSTHRMHDGAATVCAAVVRNGLREQWITERAALRLYAAAALFTRADWDERWMALKVPIAAGYVFEDFLVRPNISRCTFPVEPETTSTDTVDRLAAAVLAVQEAARDYDLHVMDEVWLSANERRVIDAVFAGIGARSSPASDQIDELPKEDPTS